MMDHARYGFSVIQTRLGEMLLEIDIGNSGNFDDLGPGANGRYDIGLVFLTMRNNVFTGGFSIIFSNLLEQAMFIFSGNQMIMTLNSASKGLMFNLRIIDSLSCE